MANEQLRDFEIRSAKFDEAEALTLLADRSKSYWPYDPEYLRLCRTVTQLTAEDIRQWPVLVAVNNRKIVGFAALCEVNRENMLDHLWIEPAYIGKGVGRALFFDIVEKARELGWEDFKIASDPYAEKFYLKLGAERIGEKESKVRKGFFLPLLRFYFP